MKCPACSIALLLLAFGNVVMGDINTTYLPVRPSASLAPAMAKATKEIKAVFVILYDDRETVKNTLEFFFDSPAVKQQFKDNFEVCVRDRRKPDVAKFDDPTHAWNRARYIVLTPNGELIHQGRFLRNDEAGINGVAEAVGKWQAVKNQFVTKQAPGVAPPPR